MKDQRGGRKNKWKRETEVKAGEGPNEGFSQMRAKNFRARSMLRSCEEA